MKAIELKKQYLKEDVLDKVGVIAITKEKCKDSCWWHVHDDEEIPEKYTIALHPRKVIT